MTGPTRFLVPLSLAAAAAVANFVLISRQTAKVEVVVLVADVPAGTVITRKHLGTMAIRADAKLFPNALRADELGLVEGMTARRSLRAGEILFRADVADDALLPLNPGEHSTWTVTVRPDRVVPFLTPGQSVSLSVPDPSDPNVWVEVGAYRLLGSNPAGTAKDPRRQLVLAVPADDPGRAKYAGLIDSPKADLVKVERAGTRRPAPPESQLGRDR
jgi:hypothetical protein